MPDPAITNTYTTLDMSDVLEDLDRTVRNVDPETTPFYSNGMKGSASNPSNHEWLTDANRAPQNAPAPEGFDADFPAIVPRVRLNNVCQIATDSAIVSDTANAAEAAPSVEEITYQVTKKGVEVRIDVETILFANNAKVATDPRETAGFPTWMVNGAVGADDALGVGGSLGVGDGSTVVTPGTARAMTIGQTDTAMQNVFAATGRQGTRMLMMSEVQKKKFSKLNFAGGGTDVAAIEASMTEARPAFSIGAVSVYLTDFGRVDLVPNVFMNTGIYTIEGFTDGTDQFNMLLDKRFYSIDSLPGRSFKSTKLAKTGSAEKWMVEWEGCLKVHNQKAHAATFAINPLL